MRLVTCTILALCGSLGAGYSASSFGAEEIVKLRYARICDTSGCYLAWDVVDSDHDGVCDADELMAGTDPYDPLSKPSLSVIVEVGGKKRLPSFEAGLGAFFVFPETMQAFVAARAKDPLAAFPIGSKRGDSLSRAGISAELLKQNGIDSQLDGFTIGIEHTTDAGLPGRRVGGIEVRLISEGDDMAPLTPLPHGGKAKEETLDGDHFVTYNDGTVRVDWETGGGMEMDGNGFVMETWYVNPDADQESTVPTPEQKVAFARLRGTAIRTMEGWSAPRAETISGDKRETIVLLDPEYAYNPAMIFEAPKVTNVQPERRPDLPQPDLPANPKGGCTVGCP
jgi:hypothetical protein